LEPISIVLIASIELRLLGPLISITWRLYFDNELSNILKTFMGTLDELKNFNNYFVLKTELFWICMIGFVIHFLLYIISVIGFITITPDYTIFAWVSNFFLVCNK